MRKPWGPLETFHWGFSYSVIREKCDQISFSSLERLPFFQKIVFSTTSQVLEKWSDQKPNISEKTLRTLTNCPLRFVTLNNTRKIEPKIFLHRRKCLFFQKIAFSTTSQVLTKWSYNFHSICQKTLCTVTGCPLRFVTLDNTRKNRLKFIWWENTSKLTKVLVRKPWGPLQTIHWGLSYSIIREKGDQISFSSMEVLPFFQKNVFSTTSQVLKKWSYHKPNKSEKTLRTLINCPLRFVTLNNTRKIVPKIFLHRKSCLLFKKLRFQQPLKSWRTDLITSTVNVKRPCGQLQTVPGGLSQLIIRWKVSQKLLSAWEQLIFGKFLAIDILGPRETTLSIAKQVSNRPCGPSKIDSWPLLCSRNWEKIGQNLFFTGNIDFFLKIFVFNNHFGPKERFLVFQQYFSD